VLRIGRLGLVLLAVLLLAAPGRFASAGDLAMVQGVQSVSAALPGGSGPEPLPDPGPAILPQIPTEALRLPRARRAPTLAPRRRIGAACRRPPSHAPPCNPQS